MKYFSVTVLAHGKKSTHGIYSKSKQDAMATAKIKFKGVIVKIIGSTPPLEDRIKEFKDNLLKSFSRKKIKQDRLIAGVRQLSVMTNAGISIHDSLSEIAQASDDEALKKIFQNVADDINQGSSLYGSMDNYRFELGNLTLAMVDLGEQTGNMDESLGTLAEMLEEIRSNFTKFKKAMAYPRNVIIAMGVAFSVLIMYVVPKFKDIFAKLGAELPLPTKILLSLENILNNYGAYVLGGAIVAFFTIRHILENDENAKFKFHQILLKTYLIKDIIYYATLNRFSLVFTELIRAGIPIADALDTAISMIDNLPLKKKLKSVRVAVDRGVALNAAFLETGLFENMIIQMISAGESSGKIDTMMSKISDYYKMKFDAIIDNLSQSIEPILLFFIAAMVILLALGIFLPMWDMGSAVKGH